MSATSGSANGGGASRLSGDWITEDLYELTMLRLKHTWRSMQRLMAASEDFFAKIMVEEAFKDLRDEIKQFARCNCGLNVAKGHKQAQS